MAERQQILLDNGGYRDFEVSLDKSLQYMGESAVSFEKDFSTSFTGRSISIYGVFWTHSVSTFQVTLDSGNPTDIINYRQGFTVNMTYSSPFLEDSMHTIKVSGLAMAYVDYMTVEMGKNPPLVRKTLIVDEGDSSITYSNETNWTRNSPIIVSRSNGVFSARLPYGGSTLDTTTFGSSATFTFTGDSVSVYGAPPEDNIGNIEFTLDGITSNRSFNETSGSPMHYPLFLSSSLPLGGHTLTVKYLEGPGALRLDYFLYTPNGHIQTGSTPSQKEGLSAGAIIGIVVGVGGFVAVLGAILFWLRRRRRQQVSAVYRTTYSPLPGHVFEAIADSEVPSNSRWFTELRQQDAPYGSVEPFLSTPYGHTSLGSLTGSQHKSRVPEVLPRAPPAYQDDEQKASKNPYQTSIQADGRRSLSGSLQSTAVDE